MGDPCCVPCSFWSARLAYLLAMLYQEIQPRIELARFIECYWTLEDDHPELSNSPDPILPDGCIEVILNLGDRFNEHRQDGRKVSQPRYFLFGQLTRPLLIAPTGRVAIIGIRFHPGGAFPLLRVPMNDLTDSLVELDALDPLLERELTRRLSPDWTLRRNIEEVEKCLIARVISTADSWLPALANSIVVSGGRQSIDQLALQAGVSGRQLQRRFLREVGIGPKMLSRILRFQEVFRAIESGRDGWAQVAAECGYYDQAHLIRDCQEFTGKTPAFLLANTSLLTESFTRKNRASHFYNTAR
jgi:AraC-like DNA-binding protein